MKVQIKLLTVEGDISFPSLRNIPKHSEAYEVSWKPHKGLPVTPQPHSETKQWLTEPQRGRKLEDDYLRMRTASEMISAILIRKLFYRSQRVLRLPMFVCKSTLSPAEGNPDGYMGYTHRFVTWRPWFETNHKMYDKYISKVFSADMRFNAAESSER
jgi:hypothetical protein